MRRCVVSDFQFPTRVTVSEGRPVRVQTDRQGFTSGAIVQAAGPWRTSGNWWATPGGLGKRGESATARPGIEMNGTWR